MTPQSFDIKGAAEYLGCHPWPIRLAIRTGKLPATRIGKSRGYNILRIDLETWASTQRRSVVRRKSTKNGKRKLREKLPDIFLYPVRKTPINLADPDETLDPYNRSKPFIRSKR